MENGKKMNTSWLRGSSDQIASRKKRMATKGGNRWKKDGNQRLMIEGVEAKGR